MNSKKAENSFINFRKFYKFTIIKNYSSRLVKYSIDKKILLIICLTHLFDKTKLSLKTINKKIIWEYYIKFCKGKNFDEIVSCLIGDYYKEKEKEFNSFIDNLFLFYENSDVQKIFLKKRNIAKIKEINEINLNKYLTINNSIMNILNFLKDTNINNFNWIYRKIILLS